MSKEKKEHNYIRRFPIFIVLAIAIVLYVFVVPETNNGNAMSPTIEDGQILVVSKSSYTPTKLPDRDQIIMVRRNSGLELSKDNIIARVAGLPGDKVEIKDGAVYVNGKEYVTSNGIKGSDGKMSIKLKEQQVFLLCDNRATHMDSRNDLLGIVELDDIQGKVLFCIWPFSKFGGIN